MNGGCCPICAALDGKHFDVDKMMPGENAPPMHPNCRCSTAAWEDDDEYEAWLDHLENGGTTETWNELKNSKKPIETNAMRVYNGGIPKTWGKVDASTDDAVKNANPSYNPERYDEYSSNCFNCVSAYEMRKRGYNVVARPASGNGHSDIVRAMQEMEDGARVEIAAIWAHNGMGHLFVAEKVDGKVMFVDPQNGDANVDYYFDRVAEGNTIFWRIDTLFPSDRGITACEKGDEHEF